MSKGWKFVDNSKKIKNQIFNTGEGGMEEALLFIESQAKALAAVDTGEMRDKIDHKISSKKKKIEGQVGSPNEHAIYNEFGTGEHATKGNGRKDGWVYRGKDGRFYFTRGQKAQPFMRPAFRRNRKKIEELIGGKYKSTFKGGVNL